MYSWTAPILPAPRELGATSAVHNVDCSVATPALIAPSCTQNADADVVPEQRWLYLSKDVLIQHLLSKGHGTWGSSSVLAQRLKSAGFRYDQVLHADHLKTMLRRERLSTAGERRLLETRLASTPPKSIAELEAEAATAEAAAAAAGGASGTPAGRARGSANAAPTQWKKELTRLAAEQEEQGRKMVSPLVFYCCPCCCSAEA